MGIIRDQISDLNYLAKNARDEGVRRFYKIFRICIIIGLVIGVITMGIGFTGILSGWKLITSFLVLPVMIVMIVFFVWLLSRND